MVVPTLTTHTVEFRQFSWHWYKVKLSKQNKLLAKCFWKYNKTFLLKVWAQERLRRTAPILGWSIHPLCSKRPQTLRVHNLTPWTPPGSFLVLDDRSRCHLPKSVAKSSARGPWGSGFQFPWAHFCLLYEVNLEKIERILRNLLNKTSSRGL